MRIYMLIFLYFFLLVTNLYATTFYISTNGSDGNNGQSESQAWGTFSHALLDMNAGDELIILDGLYNQIISISKSGTANSRIAIRAKNDGKVTIDGQSSRACVLITGNYITIEGLVCRNAANTDGLIKISGNYNVLRRISAYDMNPYERSHLFLISRGNYNLIEDCVAGGSGRIRFDCFEGRSNTFRRCYAVYGRCNVGSPRKGFCPYGAPNTLFENCIAHDVYPSLDDTYTDMEYYGFYQQTNQNPEPSNNCRYLGCISYNNLDGGMILNPNTGPTTTIINCVFFDHDRPHPDGLHSGWYGWGFYGGADNLSFNNITMRNCTFINNILGGAVVGDNAIENCIFADNGRAIGGTGHHRYCCFYNNGSIGTSLQSTDIQADPGFENGSYIYIPDNSPCKGAGVNGEDIGANILYQYVDGILTNEPLWPWPMNQRILDETGYDVTATLFSGTIPDPIFTIEINAYPSYGSIPLTVNFNSSTNGGTAPYTYFWDFGDGNSSSQQNPSHTYIQAGNYTAVLTVIDNDGNQPTASKTIQVIDPSKVLSITNIRFTLPGDDQEIAQLKRETWYDLYLYFNTPNGWSEIAYADVWINHHSYTEGTIENRGDVFYGSCSYIISLSILEGYEGIFPRQTEGSNIGTDVTGTIGLYVDDQNNEYELNSNEGWVKARIKLLSNAESGDWKINAYVTSVDNINSALYSENIGVLQFISDTIPPIPPINVKIGGI